MSTFSPTTHFFCKTHFIRKYCFQGVRALRVHVFASDTKNLQKNPEMCARDPQVVKICRFLCKLHSSGERIMWNSAIPDDENVVFLQNVQIFPTTFFFEIFSADHFFPNFPGSPTWPFLAKMTFSGHLNIFTKSSSFFSEKIVIFLQFFSNFSSKKKLQKTQKNVILQKVLRSISGEMPKIEKKRCEKYGFLLP